MNALTLGTSAIRLHDGLYSLNDLHKAAGGAVKHQPTRFIRLDQTQELVAELDSPEMVNGPVRVIKGSVNPGTYVCRELVYAYAMWISPKFHLAVIRAFDAMHTGQTNENSTGIITPSEQQLLQELVARRSAGCKEQSRGRAEIWSRIHHKFRVASYRQLQRTQLADVVHYIAEMDLRNREHRYSLTDNEIAALVDQRVKEVLEGEVLDKVKHPTGKKFVITSSEAINLHYLFTHVKNIGGFINLVAPALKMLESPMIDRYRAIFNELNFGMQILSDLRERCKGENQNAMVV